MKRPPVFHGMPGAGRKRALTLSHLETDFRDAQVIDFAGGFFVPFLTLPDTFGLRWLRPCWLLRQMSFMAKGFEATDSPTCGAAARRAECIDGQLHRPSGQRPIVAFVGTA